MKAPVFELVILFGLITFTNEIEIGLLLEGVYETIPVICATLPEMLQATSLFRPELLQYTFSPSNLS